LRDTNWKLIAELTGIAAIVASLLVLAMEVRQSRQVGRSDTATNLLQSMQQEKELIAANSDVWIKGCRGDELNDGERALFSQIVRAYIQRMYFVWLASQDSILGLSNNQPALIYAANFHRYPGFAAMALRQFEWLAPAADESNPDIQRFGEEVRSHLELLRESEPNPQFDPALCGL
jgi:hypothetical protein